MAIDHDRLFKELLTTFFIEFVELFLPPVAGELDRTSVHFMDKEIFTDVASGGRHEVDLLTKVRLRDKDACILIHVENQSTAEADFPRRMFRYYARIEAKFGLPVYPIAVFSYDRPQTPASATFTAELFDLPILRFEFRSIQLNAMDWRTYLRTPNPVAAALMAKMNIAEADRPHVKAQCARMIATLRLDPAKTGLIAVFMNTYLHLSAAEMAVYNHDMQFTAPTDKTFVIEIENEWTEIGEAKGLEKGRVEGRVEGQVRTVMKLLRRRFGDIPAESHDAIGRLSAERLDELADRLLDFQSLSDVDAWLGLNK